MDSEIGKDRNCNAKVEDILTAICDFYNSLDLELLSFVRPSKFIFLCGGLLADQQPDDYVSLRDFITKCGPLGAGGKFVLAEAANKLYESTKYKDLISFEEDVAKIAAIILVVAESPGSLAELGAFASYNPFKSNLRLIIPGKHEHEKSFIREGPVRRLQRLSSKYVAFFDWDLDSSGHLQKSISQHKEFIFSFIRSHTAKAAKEQLASSHPELRPFYLLLWIVFVSRVISFDC